MAKKVTVAMFGSQRRGVQIDIDATKGAVLGENLLMPDGTVIPTTQIINQTTVVQTESGPTSIASTIWSLILNMPAFIKALAGLATNGLVVKGAGNTAVTRSITGETGRIEIDDGDGIASNPVVRMGPWPTIKNSISVGKEYTVPSGHQLLVWDNFVYDGGNLILDGDLIVL